MSKFIYISGKYNCSSLEMECSGELQEIVKKIIDEDLKEVKSDDGSTVTLLEFGEVDDGFFDFVMSDLYDYDYLKRSCLYKIVDERGE